MNRRSSAYTLLEVMLATSLSIGLLAALWTLYNTQAQLFDKGHKRVARAQLCRALTQKIAEDLKSAIQDPVSPPLAASAGVRRFGLLGTSSDIRFDVLQVTPEQGYVAPVGRSANAAMEAEVARVPELRTIYYAFDAAGVDEATGEPTRGGLMRREASFEAPAENGGIVASEDVLDIATLDSPDEVGFAEQDDSPDAFDDSVLWVPEVANIEFRYFDGSGWASTWDSIQRKSLPVAVEVKIQMGEPPETSTKEPEDYLELEPDSALPVETNGESYRVVVDLPSAPAYRKPRPEPQATPARTVVRRIAPPRVSTRPETPHAADQWIRNAP